MPLGSPKGGRGTVARKVAVRVKAFIHFLMTYVEYCCHKNTNEFRCIYTFVGKDCSITDVTERGSMDYH